MFQFLFRKRCKPHTEPLLTEVAKGGREGKLLTLMGQLYDHFIKYNNSVSVVWLRPKSPGAPLSLYTSLNWKETDSWPADLAMSAWQRGGMATETISKQQTRYWLCIGQAGSPNGVMLVRIIG